MSAELFDVSLRTVKRDWEKHVCCCSLCWVTKQRNAILFAVTESTTNKREPRRADIELFGVRRLPLNQAPHDDQLLRKRPIYHGLNTISS